MYIVKFSNLVRFLNNLNFTVLAIIIPELLIDGRSFRPDFESDRHSV